jgi:prolipoprotein diacylglyceryl transferase
MLGLLFVHWNMNPEIFRIGGFAVRWYGVLFVSGFILGYWMFTKFCQKERVDTKMLDPLLFTLLIGTLVGARLGHCFFYQPEYYFGSWKGFLELFQIWKGGLASHGGAMMLVLCMIWFAHKYGSKYHVDFMWLVDHLAIAVAFAGAFIRLGNLCNSEIYGDVTSLPWGFIFERRGETEPKHPTQIYESLSYFILGLILVWIYVKRLNKTYRGTFIGIFFIVCFGMRFLIEFIKEPQVEFEESMALDMGQWLSIPFVILGIIALVWAYKKKIPAAAIIPDENPRKHEPTHYAKSIKK